MAHPAIHGHYVTVKKSLFIQQHVIGIYTKHQQVVSVWNMEQYNQLFTETAIDKIAVFLCLMLCSLKSLFINRKLIMC